MEEAVIRACGGAEVDFDLLVGLGVEDVGEVLYAAAEDAQHDHGHYKQDDGSDDQLQRSPHD